ncbi:MAG: glycerate kinase [Cytophagales bacterium]|nr:glycerate kinase [Cytophagales bacterium]
MLQEKEKLFLKLMKVLIAPDKFKGSLTAKEVCDAITAGVIEVFPEAEVTSIPMADGGEGTLDILKDLLDLEMVKLTVGDPYARPVKSWYGMKSQDAFIEMALASGLQLLNEEEQSASKTSTLGTGELIQHAIDRGARNIHLFVGGSATNDGGIGVAHALGFRFLDQFGKELSAIGQNLGLIDTIQKPERSFQDITFQIITDVKNPLLGSDGATNQYGPQKGAKKEELASLEQGMSHYANLIQEISGIDHAIKPGSGAAGGIGMSVMGLLKGEIRNGMETLLNITGFAKQVAQADLVITGEGKIDVQTLQGKVVHGVAKAGIKEGVPVVAICGINQLNEEEWKGLGLQDATSLKSPELTAEYCMQHAAELICLRVSKMAGKLK